MTLNREDPMGKAQDWSVVEHNLLVDMTNQQIQLESADGSKVIPWAEHWRNVSNRLGSHGFARTDNACRSYAKRLKIPDVNGEGAKRESDERPSGADTAIPAFRHPEDSNKRPLPRETDTGDKGISSKKGRWGESIGYGTVDATSVPEDQHQISLGQAEGEDTTVTNMPDDNRPTAKEIANLETAKTIQQNGDLRVNNKTKAQSDKCDSTNPQQPITPPTTPSPSIGERELVSKSIRRIKTEIQALKKGNAEQNDRVILIERGVDILNQEYDQCCKAKEQALRAMEDKYNRNLEVLKLKLTTLEESKKNELDSLNKTALQISRKEAGLVHYQEVISYLDAEGLK